MNRFALLTLMLLTVVNTSADESWTPPPPRRIDGSGMAKPGVIAPPISVPTTPLKPWDEISAWQGLLVGLGLGLSGIGIYKLILEPRSKRRPFVEALKIINMRDSSKYPEAERLLAQALTLGLATRDVTTARFQLAFLRARAKRYAEALAILSDLNANERDRAALYLELWLQYNLKAMDCVEALYRDHSDKLGDFLDTRTIVSIVYLERARTYWAAKQINAAVEYFNKVRSLGMLEMEIPEHIDDHQIVLGVAAIHEENFDQAAQHFRGAVSAALGTGKPTVAGRLGELICDWRTNDDPEIDEPLGAIANELLENIPSASPLGKVQCEHANCRYEFCVALHSAGKRAVCTHCRRYFRLPSPIQPLAAETSAETIPDRLLVDDELMVRNVLLWHVILRIFDWKKRPHSEPIPDNEWQELRHRLDRVRNVDPTMPDPDLLEGLMTYYFAEDDHSRAAAITILDNAVKGGVNLPAIIDLIAREKKVAAYLNDGLARFFGHVQNYVGDGLVPIEYRRDLFERLRRFSRFRQLLKPQANDDGDAAPSLEDLQNRSQILRDRVYNVHRQLLEVDPDGEDAKLISALVDDLEITTDQLVDTARSVERTEHELMASTSEFLLREDDAISN